MAHEWRRGAYLVTTDKARLDLEMIHGFLKDSTGPRAHPRRQ